MNHPYELLADLVDGTLDEGDLAGVQAHLDGCAACRDDVRAARAGAEAARTLPLVAPPADLLRRVVDRNGGRSAPSWYGWAGVAAAAAVVAVIALALPNVGDGDTSGGSEGAPADRAATAEDAQGALSADDVAVQIEDADYDPRELEELAADSARNAATGAQEASPIRTADGDPGAALRCVRSAFDQLPVGRLARLIRARFEGRDAYIAVYLEGPGADQLPTLAAVWVASADDCAVLSLASARIRR
jgi:hypothetical protein